MPPTVTVDLADLMHVLRQAGFEGIRSNQFVRLTNAALIARLAVIAEKERIEDSIGSVEN